MVVSAEVTVEASEAAAAAVVSMIEDPLAASTVIEALVVAPDLPQEENIDRDLAASAETESDSKGCGLP